LIGGLTKFIECHYITEAFKNLWDVDISIPKYLDYATAIGAVIAANHAEKIG
jgi:activator of 2-hydroxyglutaryl-CoA dehydratase